MKIIYGIALGLISTNCLADPSITLLTTTDNAYGLEQHDVYAYSKHDIQIINDTNQDQTYSYSYSLCVKNHGCQQKANHVTVKAHNRFNNHCDLTHMAKYKYAGPYEMLATTQVRDKILEAKALVIIRQ